MNSLQLVGANVLTLLEPVLQASADAVLILSADGRVVFANRCAQRLFGHTRDRLLQLSWESLIPARFRDASRPLPGAGHGVPREGEEPLLCLGPDNTEVAVESWKVAVMTASEPLLVVYLRDVTVLRRAESLQQHMLALVESADDAIVTKDLNGVVRSWNPAAERLLGYTAAEMIDQPITRVIPSDRQSEEAMILERIRNGQRVAHFETVRQRKNGTTVDVSVTISPLRDSRGVIVGASKIIRDNSERILQEEQLRRSNAELEFINEELDAFVYTASHDLRSPLNAIGAVAQWIIDDDKQLSAQSCDRLLLIRSRIERMHRLLDDIRTYTVAGRLGAASGPRMTAGALVRDVAATLFIPEGFEVHADASLELIEINRVPLHQIMLNLISNAVKHHDSDHGEIAVSATQRDSWLRFVVSDDGPGIPPEYRQTVFRMFSTLKPRDHVEGSGMGLALVKKIVERFGGHCGVENTEGRGARVWFDWPKRAGEMEAVS